MEDEATKEFTLGDGEEEATTSKGKGKKRKAPAKKDSPSKKAKEEVKEQSKLVSGGILKDFQRVGVDWMIARHMNTSVSSRLARQLRDLGTDLSALRRVVS
jgi:hypothetical protein